MVIEAVIEEALKLPPEERSELIERLLESLEDGTSADPDHDAAWTEVIDRRLQEARSGRVQLIDASEALIQARAAIGARRR
jgi:putative addiction module component (TIGR02574 family)